MDNISIILNVYKRPHMLEEQIRAIKNQSINIKSENIHVWYNKSDVIQDLPIDKKINTYRSSRNTKFWGRFTLPLIVKTEYVALFDDDTIPQKDWLKNCIETIEDNKTNGILGGAGIKLIGKYYHPNKRVGWNGTHSNKTEQVDLVGHAWFFRQEWTKYLWYEKPYNWDNGEDIMFSYLAQKYGKINTYVPPHPENNKDLWSTNYNISIKVGTDKNAVSIIRNDHFSVRGKISKYCIDNGWKTVNKIV